MKRNPIVRIIVYSLLALVLTGVLISGIDESILGFHMNMGTSGTAVEGEAEFAAATIKKLEIDWAAGSVVIRTADTDQITVSETRPEDSKYKLTYQISGDTLNLAYATGTIGIGFGNWELPSKDLLIVVPRDWVCEELEIDGAALEIDVQDLTIEKFTLDGASCDVNLVSSIDKVEIDGASTKIRLSSSKPISSIQIDGASCDLELTLPKDCGFHVEMDGLSWKFQSDLEYSQGINTYTYGDKHCKVYVNGISCSVIIQENPVWPITGE